MEWIIPEFPEYKINTKGEVYSRYKFKTAIVTGEWRLVKPVLDKGVGYYLVTMVNATTKVRKNQFIHRLLAQGFIPNIFMKPQVNHIDGNKRNNTLTNLEWATSQENSQHSVDLGMTTFTHSEVAIEQYSTDKVTLLATHRSLHEAGRATAIQWQNISKVCRGQRNSAGGFYWKYK